MIKSLGNMTTGIARAHPSARRWTSLIILASVLLSIWITGCTSTRMTMTPRSRMEQELLVLAFERAVSRLDIQSFTGKRVALEIHGLSKDDLPYATEFVGVWLEQHGVQVVEDDGEVDMRLKGFAKVIAVDQSETLIGTPEFIFLGIPIPSIAIYRNVRNRGRTEIELYALDGKTDRFVYKIPGGEGDAKHDQYTILFVISWTSSDLKKKSKNR